MFFHNQSTFTTSPLTLPYRKKNNFYSIQRLYWIFLLPLRYRKGRAGRLLTTYRWRVGEEWTKALHHAKCLVYRHLQRKGEEWRVFGTGTSHRPISQRNTGRQPYGKRAFSETLCSNPRTAGTAQEMERRSRRKRRNTRRNGTCLDIAAERCNQRIGRSQLYRPTGKEYEVCAC